MDDLEKQKVLRAWKDAKQEYLKSWSASNGRAYGRFRDSFVEAASARYGIPKGEVRRVVEGPKPP